MKSTRQLFKDWEEGKESESIEETNWRKSMEDENDKLQTL